MIITGITPEQFRDAVAKAGAAYGNNLEAEIGREYSLTRFRGRVVLRDTGYQLYGSKDTSRLAPGQRRTANAYQNERRINAVCWHGYRDVLIALFDAHPDAKVRTAMAKYLGRESFYREFPQTGHKNIGSIMYPVTMPETCDCEA